jgi:prepilin-type N-terminal cleavage/methylation domain-containing protein
MLPNHNKSFSMINHRTIKLNPKGFTLIELLVAVAIIAIISAIGFASYSQAQILGRDAKRKQDLRSIATALELYYQSNKTYPDSSLASTCSHRTSSTPYCLSDSNESLSPPNPWIYQLNSTYINKLPKDPKSNGADPRNPGPNFGYAYYGNPLGCNGGPAYLLVTQLENSGDPDTLAKQHYTYSSNDLTPLWNPNLFAITSCP